MKSGIVGGLEKEIQRLTEENTKLKRMLNNVRDRQPEIKSLKAEIGYLKSQLAPEHTLNPMISSKLTNPDMNQLKIKSRNRKWQQ